MKHSSQGNCKEWMALRRRNEALQSAELQERDVTAGRNEALQSTLGSMNFTEKLIIILLINNNNTFN